MILLKSLSFILTFICVGLNLSLFVRLRPPASFYFVIFQLIAGAMAPILVICGIVGAVIGWFTGEVTAVTAGLIGASMSLIYIILVTSITPGFAEAFGEKWEDSIPLVKKKMLIPQRWQLMLPKTPEPVFEQDIPFWTIPGTTRNLLCDIWQPAAGVERSGMAIIFLHGSAWYFLDKDNGTRPLFRQLTAHGHVVMDVAYRLTPEVDIYGMVGDVKRAIIWMKDNAHHYHIDPDRIILGGGSAGGHLALLAAYTPEVREFSPEEIIERDCSIKAVFSLYGPTDLTSCYHHLDQKRLVGMPKVEIGQPGAATMEKNMKDAGRLDMLLGGHLHEVPESYKQASPVSHVSSGSPQTLLIQGMPDVIAPLDATRQLHEKLVNAGVPSVKIFYPFTNHAFDLIFPKINPAGLSTFRSIGCFLELVR